jgi:competence protein ComEC
MAVTSWLLPAGLVGVAIGVAVADPGHPLPEWSGPLAALLSATGALCVLVGVASRTRSSPAAAAWLAGTLLVAMSAGLWRAGTVMLPSGRGSVSGAVSEAGDHQFVVMGTAVDDPRPDADRQQVIIDGVRLDGRAVKGRMLAWVPRSTAVRAGDAVKFSAKLEAPRDSNGFEYRAYLARQGVGAIARTFEASSVAGPPGPPRLAATARQALLDGLNGIVPEPEASLVAGILLGVRTSIDPAVSASFATAGLTHVVAISGWNIAIVAALVARLVEGWRRRAGGRIAVPAVTVGAIGSYVLLVGSSPSVVRAALMAAAMLFGRQAGSRAHAASALALAALVMILVAPAVVWDVGFQLSLLATAGLIAFGAGIEARLGGWPGWLREPVALTIAAQLATLPIILITFGRLSLVAPLANVLVVPLVPLVMLASAAAAPVGALDAAIHVPLLGDLATWFTGGTAWLGLRAMIAIGSGVAALPFASLPVSAPGWIAAVWYPALLLAWRVLARRSGRWRDIAAETVAEPMRMALRSTASQSVLEDGWSAARDRIQIAVAWSGRPRHALLLLLAALALTTVASLPDGKLHLVMLDIGQGDAILVLGPTGRSLLVDGGPDPDLVLRRLGGAVPWWRRSIDTLILTHPHQDHVGGLPAVLQRYRVGTILDAGRPYPNPTYSQFLALARREPGARLLLARAGQRVELDRGTTLRIWYPSDADARAPLLDSDINNASIVSLLTYGRFSSLLTGDAKAVVEAILGRRSELRPIDVLKVGHHGSNFSSSPAFLSALGPAAGLISVGAGNPYGHPGAQTLRALSRASVEVRRTDRDGTVEVMTDGATWAIRERGQLGPIHVAGRPGKLAATSDQTARAPTGTRWPSTASIGAWRFPTLRRRAGFWRRAVCRPPSSRIRRASRGWQQRPRDSWPLPESPSTWSGSRSPPSSTTSTSH